MEMLILNICVYLYNFSYKAYNKEYIRNKMEKKKITKQFEVNQF